MGSMLCTLFSADSAIWNTALSLLSVIRWMRFNFCGRLPSVGKLEYARHISLKRASLAPRKVEG